MATLEYGNLERFSSCFSTGDWHEFEEVFNESPHVLLKVARVNLARPSVLPMFVEYTPHECSRIPECPNPNIDDQFVRHLWRKLGMLYRVSHDQNAVQAQRVVAAGRESSLVNG